LNKEKISKLLLITLIIKKYAQYSDDKILDLLQDGIVCATNLKFIGYQCTSFPKIQEEFGSFFAIHLGCKSHTCYQLPKKLKEVPATSPISDAISKDLKNADSNL
jgi:DNA-3-methyladenine glycosylase I